MEYKITMARVGSRLILALALTMGLASVLLSLVFESHRLTGLSEAAWAMFGVGMTQLGLALVAAVRGVFQNPSDRQRVTEED